MLAGTTEEERRGWNLDADPRVYHYINQSNCYKRRDGVMDADLWAELNKAMKVMGLRKTVDDGVLPGGVACAALSHFCVTSIHRYTSMC